ncbi:MAG: histidine triad nucleotide-binding protein [Phascolarctobacterium sp.]|nr:histidine triad nucleotide-binding protein [Phascolarctobacterium sp.]
MAEDCIFCKIIKGDIPSARVYEDEKMIAINDVAPAAPVHVLLLPKEHTANITTADPELVAHMLSKVQLIAEKTGIAAKGFRLVINTGDDGGQTVKHLHIHLIGGKELGWPPC